MKLHVQFCIWVVTLWFLPQLLMATNVTEKCGLVVNCTKKAENASESCYDFMKLLDKNCGNGPSYCDKYKKDLIKACTAGFCKKCLENANSAYEDCIAFYEKSVSSKSEKEHCEDVKKDLTLKCPLVCHGDVKGMTKENPGESCRDILDSSSSVEILKSGLYWIQPDGDYSPAQSYCDMTFQNGGWTLASYGYVAASKFNVRNKNIPNMNHPNGYTWHPEKRNSSQGVIALEHGAVNLARGAKYMIMAAGSNPVSGGINLYSYVYFIDISKNPYKITFANHNRYHGGNMHVVEFTVKALKGETGSEKRYALGEALGVSWSDAYPSGYGFSPNNAQYSAWSKGPFFPSIHCGDGGHEYKGAKSYAPDVAKGHSSYTHYGWHSLHSITPTKTGQTSIWFK